MFIARIKELIELKATISEAYLHKGEKELIDFIKTCIDKADSQSQSLPASKGQMTELNEFFRQTLN